MNLGDQNVPASGIVIFPPSASASNTRSADVGR